MGPFSRTNKLLLAGTVFLTLIRIAPLEAQQHGSFVNGNFESGDFSGWTKGGGYWSGGWPLVPSSYLPGGSNFNSRAFAGEVFGPGPQLDDNTDRQLDSVYSGFRTARVNDAQPNNSVSIISQTVTNYTAAHIYFAWAAVLQASHGPNDSDNFVLELRDVTTDQQIYQVAYNSALAQTAPLFRQSENGWFYTSWQVQDLDVSERAGHTFTLTLLASDCPYGGHAGYVYLDGFGSITPPSGERGGEGGGLTVTGTRDLGTVLVGGTVSGNVSVTGGIPPYTFSGTAPAGYTVADGALNGTASVAGNFSATIVVTDSAGSSGAATFTWSVFGFSLRTLPDGVQYSPYVASLGLAGGTAPYRFTTSGLPPGLSATTSGTIQGTSRDVGSWPVTVGGVDADGRAVSIAYTLRFIPPPPMRVTSTSLPAGDAGGVFSQSLTAVGGAPPYTWNLTSGALPGGLGLRPAGTIAGIPTQPGTFVIGVRVTDVTGAGASGEVRLTLKPVPLSVTTPSPLATGMASVEYPDHLFTATGGTAPYRFSVTSGSLPAGLSLSFAGKLSGVASASSAGAYSFVVTVTDAEGRTGTATPALTIRPYGTDILLSSGSLLFELTAGSSTLPRAQVVGVQLTKPGFVLPYSVTVLPTDNNWLSVQSGAAAPGMLTIGLTDAALQMAASGTPYTATVQAVCTDTSVCGGTAQTVEIALRISNLPPRFSVQSDLISFSTSPGSGATLTQQVSIENPGGGSVGISSITCGAPWCRVNGTPGFLASGSPALLDVIVDPTGLRPGYYRTTVTWKTSAGTSSTPVTLFISNSGTFTLQPSGAQFLSSAGGVPVGGTTSFFVTPGGGTSVSWNAAVVPGANWLALDDTSGTSTGADPSRVRFSINSGVASGLAAGTYYGQIRVTAPEAANSPRDFVVVLNVAPAGTAEVPIPVPGGLLFISGSSNKIPAQTVNIATGSAQPVTYTATVDAASPWLRVSPASGTAVPGSPASSNISIDTKDLKPGVYQGGVNYEFGGPVRSVNVTLIVPATGEAVANAAQGLTSKATCIAKQLVAAPTGLPRNFSAPAAWPTPITIRLYDDCGDPVTNGQVVVSFSNGDPPLALPLADPKSATYAATWTPRKASAQLSIRARSVAPGLLGMTSELAGAVNPNAAPLLEPNGALHIYNPLVGGALAPGTLITLRGSALSGIPVTAPTGTLPTTLGGTRVLIGGVQAPVAAVSPTSLTLQTPLQLEATKQYQVIVNANGALSTPESVQLSIVSPGVKASEGGIATAFVKGLEVTQSAPAAPGDKVTILAAGLGTTDPVVEAGTVTPADAPVRVSSAVTLKLDGKPVTVDFAGLQAGSVGVYQVDFTLPADTPNGDLQLRISQEGEPANTVVLPVKKP
ncbi:MAG: hypothetical protein JWN34_3616 [Bryobacterales bacterium]|nr:hypothetical protein [Bryobacterales bacterium]